VKPSCSLCVPTVGPGAAGPQVRLPERTTARESRRGAEGRRPRPSKPEGARSPWKRWNPKGVKFKEPRGCLIAGVRSNERFGVNPRMTMSGASAASRRSTGPSLHPHTSPIGCAFDPSVGLLSAGEELIYVFFCPKEENLLFS